MEELGIGYVLLIALFAIIQIVMIVKFFQIATDVRLLRKASDRDFRNSTLKSEQHLQLVEATKNVELPQITKTDMFGNGIEFRFGDIKCVIYKDNDLWWCSDGMGGRVYATGEREALKFCYHIRTNK